MESILAWALVFASESGCRPIPAFVPVDASAPGSLPDHFFHDAQALKLRIDLGGLPLSELAPLSGGWTIRTGPPHQLSNLVQTEAAGLSKLKDSEALDGMAVVTPLSRSPCRAWQYTQPFPVADGGSGNAGSFRQLPDCDRIGRLCLT
jgi:hypothetical protein